MCLCFLSLTLYISLTGGLSIILIVSGLVLFISFFFLFSMSLISVFIFIDSFLLHPFGLLCFSNFFSGVLESFVFICVDRGV